MEEDGTVFLRLRARTDDGSTTGEGLLSYQAGDPDYQGIVERLGGIVIGEYKAVTPWPP